MLVNFTIIVLLISKNLMTTSVFLVLSVALFNFISVKNHMALLLLMLELISLLILFNWVFFLMKFGLSLNVIFIFMVMMVAEACLSLSLLTSLSRAKSGELEISAVSL